MFVLFSVAKLAFSFVPTKELQGKVELQMKSKTLVTHQVLRLMQRVSATYNLTSDLMSRQALIRVLPSDCQTIRTRYDE